VLALLLEQNEKQLQFLIKKEKDEELRREKEELLRTVKQTAELSFLKLYTRK